MASTAFTSSAARRLPDRIGLSQSRTAALPRALRILNRIGPKSPLPKRSIVRSLYAYPLPRAADPRMSAHSSIGAPRRTRRTRVLMTGVLMTPAGAQKVILRDISRTGAHLAGASDVPSDCDAIFRRGSLFAAARVSWVRGGEIGISFYRELSSEEVEASLPNTLLR
jgi:hypothetical protein